MVMAVNRICAVIWLLGDDRQLLPYEIAPPSVVSGSIVPVKCPTTPRSSTSGSWDDEAAYGSSSELSPEDDEKAASQNAADSSFQTQTSATPYPWEKESADNSTTPAIGFAPSATSRPPSYRTGGSTSRGVVAAAAPVWGPVTAVFSPDVARSQWRIAAYALLVGVTALCTIGVVLMAVPNA